MNKLLIVDDAPGWRKYHKEKIENVLPDKYIIDTAESALDANNKLYDNSDSPYDVILTDMQMETNFLPLLAGEWLIEQIQQLPEYKNTKIIIISANPNIKMIAERYNVSFIPKYMCRETNSYINQLS